ncbi:MAG: DoxX family protein [Candidatus Aminicenantes bacterium]|nr:DoxX family protein [Candidatus Aminicenantes bacterium]
MNFISRFIPLFRIVVGGVFLWAGVIKVLDPMAFARSIEAYRVFPRPAAFFLALALPYVETACGVLLILGLFRRPAALSASLFLTGFIVLVAATIISGLDVSCGCFGSFSGKADALLLIQDFVLLGMSVMILLGFRDRLSLDEVLARRRQRPPA